MTGRRRMIWTGGLAVAILAWVLAGCFSEREAPPRDPEPARLDLSLQVEEREGKSRFRWELVNEGKEPVELVFGSDRQTELAVVDGKGREVFRWPGGDGEDDVERIVRLEPGNTLDGSADWDRRLPDGKTAAGEHTVTVNLLLAEINGQKVKAGVLREEKTWTLPKVPTGRNPAEPPPREGTDRPVPGNEAFRNVRVEGKGGRYRVRGEARVFEGTFRYAVSDGHDYLTEGAQQVGGAPAWSPFDFRIDIPRERLPVKGTLTLELFADSPKDGSRIHEWTVPLEIF